MTLVRRYRTLPLPGGRAVVRTRLLILAGAVVTSLAAAIAPPVSPTANLRYGSWGVDLTTRDLGVRPGDDFDRYAGGAWSDRTPIPADGSYAGPYDDLERLSQRRIAAIVAASRPDTPIRALYRSYLDEGAIARTGSAPVRSALTALTMIADREALAGWLGASAAGFGNRLFDLGVGLALDDPDVMRVHVGQGGLGLPDRDYYLLDRFATQRAAYRAYVEQSLGSSGSPTAAADADAVLAFETQIAKVHYRRADARDPAKSLRPGTVGELATVAPGFAWSAFMAGAQLPTAPATPIVLMQDRAVAGMAALYQATQLPVLKAWAAFHLIDDAAPYLAPTFADRRARMDQMLQGTTEQPSRERRALLLVNDLLGDDVGRDYVRRYFTAADRKGAATVVDDVRAALRRRLAASDWLSPGSRRIALAKLDRVQVMLGWPDTWHDHAGVRLRPDDLFGNVAALRAQEWAFQRSLLAHPVDSGRWIISPQTVNAYNGGQEMKIVLPAARLQPPNFSRAADPALNYGALGALAGHELSHSFDNRGRLVDAGGRIRDWWTPADVRGFEQRTAALGRQYAAYEAVPGVHLDPQLTMSENIADLVGLEAALDAYHARLGGRPAPVIGGLSGDQRFFLAYAQSRREKTREEDLRRRASRDAHAPGRFRVIGPVRNIDAWYAAFTVAPSARYYLPPAERAEIW